MRFRLMHTEFLCGLRVYPRFRILAIGKKESAVAMLCDAVDATVRRLGAESIPNTV